MATKLVTQREYLAVVGSNPSLFAGDLDAPVERVSWSDATNYCAILTQRELTAGRIPAGSAFRLPTEAEWEFCCRAGTTTRFFYGDDPNYLQLTNHAWFSDNSDAQTHTVATKPGNAWGFFDMAGNVWQWCEDWYGAYPGGSVFDPTGASTNSGGGRVLRGGSWIDEPRFCRSACRIGDDPSGNSLYENYGFRVVLAPAN
jgi:formylglycine-generating enzyme required for sulfatase activity